MWISKKRLQKSIISINDTLLKQGKAIIELQKDVEGIQRCFGSQQGELDTLKKENDMRIREIVTLNDISNNNKEKITDLRKENAEQFKTLLNHNDLLIHTKEMITLHEETLVLLLNSKITNVLCQINQARTAAKKESKQPVKTSTPKPMESCVGVKKETPKKTTTKTTKKPQK